jgi:hypothetical protein
MPKSTSSRNPTPSVSTKKAGGQVAASDVPAGRARHQSGDRFEMARQFQSECAA